MNIHDTQRVHFTALRHSQYVRCYRMKLPRNASEASAVTKSLRDWYTHAVQSRRTRSQLQTQIINPLLCQEVLQRLAPSLERHKGCDLIDVNPGVSLWSQYLHDFLKPRRHILVERQRDLFAPYLDPLLTAPDSRYTWTDHELKDIFSNDLNGAGPELPQNKRYITENPNILVTASFSNHNVHITRTLLAKAAPYYFNDLYASLYGLRSDLFRYGLFRSLVWLPDEIKGTLLPRTVDRQSKQAITFAATSFVKEVAGSNMSNELNARRVRHPGLAVEDKQAMVQHEIDSGLVVPKSRVHRDPAPRFEHLQPSVETWMSTEFDNAPAFLPELLELDERIRHTHPHLYRKLAPHWARPVADAVKRTSARSSLMTNSPDVKRWLHLYARARRRHTLLHSKTRVIQEQRSIEQEWRAAETHGDTDALAALKLRNEANAIEIAKQPGNDGNFVRKAIDDYRAFDTKSFSWYRRPYNPLAVDNSDFSTGKVAGRAEPLALVDIEPNPQFRTTFREELCFRCFEYVLARLTTSWRTDIRTALTQVVPGGIDEFIETVPSLREARKGGWPDLGALRVRSLPPETWVDIALAYYHWPFRLDEQRLWHELTITKDIDL